LPKKNEAKRKAPHLLGPSGCPALLRDIGAFENSAFGLKHSNAYPNISCVARLEKRTSRP